MEKKISAKNLYLIIVLVICYLLGIITLFCKDGINSIPFKILQIGFTFFPILTVLGIKFFSKDKTPWNLSLKVWKRPLLWAFCAFVPSILIIMGAILYFVVFPKEYSGVFNFGLIFGANATARTISSPVSFSITLLLITALLFPLQIFELGEEIGWRGYLLPKQIKKYGIRKAILINSTLWGIAHFPLIYFGFNYSLENTFAPWSNMLMMLLLSVVLGIIFSYVTIISGNCMYSAIIHGAINFLGEVPLAIAITNQKGLLGPNPSGLISMTFLIILAVILFIRSGKVKNMLQ